MFDVLTHNFLVVAAVIGGVFTLVLAGASIEDALRRH